MPYLAKGFQRFEILKNEEIEDLAPRYVLLW